MLRTLRRPILVVALLVCTTQLARAQKQDPDQMCLDECWQTSQTHCSGQSDEWCNAWFVGCVDACSHP